MVSPSKPCDLVAIKYEDIDITDTCFKHWEYPGTGAVVAESVLLQPQMIIVKEELITDDIVIKKESCGSDAEDLMGDCARDLEIKTEEIDLGCNCNEHPIELNSRFEDRISNDNYETSKWTENKNSQNEKCEKTFSNKSILKDILSSTGETPYSHILTNTAKNSHSCTVCQQMFDQKYDLNQHILTHHSDKSHKCYICEKKFVKKHQLRTHMLTHTGEKPHKCNLCGKQFLQRCNLRVHLLTHTDEKTHVCEVCETKFSMKNYLKRHMLTHHSGDKSYECNLCEKKYALKYRLDVHMLTHTGEKPHKCTMCDKHFSRKSHLNDHMLTHTGEKQHKCIVCGKKFLRKGSLNEHMAIHTRTKSQKGKNKTQSGKDHKNFSQNEYLINHLM